MYPYDNLSFASKGGLTCGAGACANIKTSSLQQIDSMVHILKDLAIDADLAKDLDVDLLGPFTTVDTDVEPLRVRKTIYLPAPFVGLFLERDLTLAEACTRICGAILDRVQDVDCQTIIDWLIVALKK